MMKRTRKKRQRAMPRTATPPVSFRSEETGDRTILMVDESFSTETVTRTNSRQPIFLWLGPGLKVLLESRRIAKRRFAQLRIEAVKLPLLDYTGRTDSLASQLKVRLGDLPPKLEVSRASFFAYRSGQTPISSKAWRKLERAERGLQ